MFPCIVIDMDGCFKSRLKSLKKAIMPFCKPVCVYSKDGCLLYSNESFNNIFSNTDMFDCITGRKYRHFLDDSNSGVVHLLTKDGRSFDVYVTYEGRSNQYVVIADDISKYTEQQNKLFQFHEYHTNFIKSMYPKHIIDALYRNRLDSLSRHHKNITICFADIKGFTDLCSTLKPSKIMGFLNALFGEFDSLLVKYNIFKLETVGDCYVTVSGLVNHKENGDYIVEQMDSVLAAENMLNFAKDMINRAYRIRIPGKLNHVELRVGINSGDVTSGVIDNTMPKFCLFGDAMNMASRMETTGKAMHIHVSSSTYSLLSDKEKEKFVKVNTFIKGKGEIETYLLCCRKRVQRTSSMPFIHLISESMQESSSGESSPVSKKPIRVHLEKLASITKANNNVIRKSFDI